MCELCVSRHYVGCVLELHRWPENRKRELVRIYARACVRMHARARAHTHTHST
jgi:hypothetical protein